MEQTGWLTPDEFWEQFERAENLVRDSAGDLPCFGVSGWSGPVALGEWDLGSRPPVTVSLVHGPADGTTVQVWTTSQDPRRAVELYRIAEGPSANPSNLGTARNLLKAASTEKARIPVDGVRVSFTVWPDADRWWAAGTHAGYGVMIHGRGIGPESLALEQVHDIEPYLSGRRAQIRGARNDT